MVAAARGKVAVFVGIDRASAECGGIRVARCGARFGAFERSEVYADSLDVERVWKAYGSHMYSKTVGINR